LISNVIKNKNPGYNENLNNKPTSSICVKNYSSKGGSIIKLEKYCESEEKIIEELTLLVKNIFDSNRGIKLNINEKPYNTTIQNNLDKILSDNFDIFKFNSDCYNNSVYVLMNYYFQFYQWDKLKVSEKKYQNLVYNIQKNYNDNPYHNAIHAADVTNTLFFLYEKLDVIYITNPSNLDVLVSLLSCATHDLDHPGNNNNFEINTKSLLALTYNDKSVLENYHLFLFFNLLMNDKMNIFADFDIENVKMIRKQFISIIIATDMMNHKNDFKKLQETIIEKDFNFDKKENKEFMITQLVHFADISNGTKPFNIYKRWVDLLFNEFFKQGDNEKSLGIPISMLCDREKTFIPESQVFFISFITYDFTKAFTKIFPKFEILIETLETNKKIWENLKGKTYMLPEN